MTRARLRCESAGVMAVACLLLVANPGHAQEAVRVAAAVDYVGADGIYLTVGSDQGAVLGDTVDVFADSLGSPPVGRVVLSSVTRRRSVAQALPGTRRFATGDALFVSLVPPIAIATSSSPTAPVPAVAPRAERSSASTSGVSLSGRLSLDLDARETRTEWGGDLFGEARRRFATPTTRLSLQASRLPGGVVLTASLRASYRYDDLSVGPPPLSLRAYELSAVKSFQAPLIVMLGRFSNPYERYSAYWDGVLVRVGRESGLGVGVVVGYEPDRHDEGFSTDLPKVTGFADYSGRGGSWRYDTDLSVHYLRPSGSPHQSYAGWSQRLALGPFDVSQRVRLDGGLDGRTWSMSDVRFRAGIDVVGPLRLRGTFGRSRAWSGLPAGVLADPLGPTREETTVGVDISGSRASASVDGGRTRRDGTDAGWSLSGTLGLRAGAGGISVAGQRWTRGAAESMSLSPTIDARIRGLDWRAGYRFYRTDLVRAATSHVTHAQVAFDLSEVLHLTLRGERQWGAQLSGTALRVSMWRSF